ncbi:MAG: hypothetical protein IAF02_18835 [Anaerolineae bacterium]|nr:hypothetical protein [Anaerolineae bacterium]
MSEKTEALLTRLDEIGYAVAGSEGGLGLLALGSVGDERERLDDYSDLDFFVIVEPAYKELFIHDLSWLSGIAPVAYAFQNTADGCKLLFVDGVFCEYAVFTPDELAHAAYTGGLWVWRRADFEIAIGDGGKRPFSSPLSSDPQWLIGEALTNLYVGLNRYHRGEKLSAMRFIQSYAVDRVLDLVPFLQEEQPALRDPFASERRFEQRFPEFSGLLPSFMPGYKHSLTAARNILNFLDDHFEISQAMKVEIISLCGIVP